MVIINMVLNVLKQTGISVSLILENWEDPLKELSECTTAEELKKYFEYLISKTGSSIPGLKRYSNDYKLKQITDYIKENYYKDIYLELIAERLGLTAKYVSQFFKDQTGINLIDYINKIRIEKAKEILKDSNNRLSDIAETTGFKRLKSFMMTFKKYIRV